MKRVLLHVCCAPCATHPLEVLEKENRIVGFFFNPNIQPLSEYNARLREVRRLFEETGRELIAPHYDPEPWNEAVRGLEGEPEGGARCEVCYRFRLKEAARAARKAGCEAFTTTLTVSRHKNTRKIHAAGELVETETGIHFRKDDFKKGGGEQRCLELSRQWGFYRQNYCGCLFSRRDREKRNDKN